MSLVLNGAGEISGITDLSDTNSQPILGRRNLIINGAMQVAQRGTSVSTVGNNIIYLVDRQQVFYRGDGEATVSQDTDVPTGEGFASSLKIDVTTAATLSTTSSLYDIKQNIEGQNLQQLKKGTANAEALTVSFWIKSATTGTYIVELNDANSRQVSASYTVNTANTWEKKTITFAGDTSGAITNDNTTGLTLRFVLGAGSDYTSGTLNTTWDAITNANRYVGQVNAVSSTSSNVWLTGVQLEVGSDATPFEHRSYGEELALCQRYYIDALATGADYIWCYPLNLTSNYRRVSYNFPVTMRAVPTTAVYASTNGTLDTGRPSVERITTHFLTIDADVTSSSAYAYITGIGLDAEL